MTRLLAIDDEPKNLKLIKCYLAGTDYEILTAEDGVKGLETLQNAAQDIDLILLDRMMPNMDGIEFLQKVKATPETSSIPVIMQTAAAESKQVVEGIQAGVYYYLTKPFDKEVLLSLINSALRDSNSQTQLREKINHQNYIMELVQSSDFRFQTLEDTRKLTVFLANLYPDPERVLLGLSELMINAVEHGNLGITYDEKTILNRENRWEEEVLRRQRLPENKDKYGRVRYEKQDGEIVLTITDTGNGFDWKNYMEMDVSRATDNHGRGIAMSKLISFDHIEYHGQGNEVVCKVSIPMETQEKAAA